MPRVGRSGLVPVLLLSLVACMQEKPAQLPPLPPRHAPPGRGDRRHDEGSELRLVRGRQVVVARSGDIAYETGTYC